MPQQIGESRNKRPPPQEKIAVTGPRDKIDKYLAVENLDRSEWNSDDEAFDEFGRRKRAKPSNGNAASAKDLKAAKQKAALARLQSKSSSAGSTKPRQRSRSRSPLRR